MQHRSILYIIIILCSISLFATKSCNYADDCYDKNECTARIKSIKSSSSVSGYFFIGIGEVHERSYYRVFIAVDDKDSYKMVNLPVECWDIVEYDGIPHAEFPRLIGSGSSKGNRPVDYVQYVPYGTLYVPRGTIVENFEL